MNLNNKVNPYTSKDVSPIMCISCGKEIKNIDEGSYVPESSMWDGGIVMSISAPYGSMLDGEVYLIGICDKCLIKKRNEGTAIYLYDYMDNSLTNKNRKLYNKKLHRKIKINRILKK